jgi:hypothetical protein
MGCGGIRIARMLVESTFPGIRAGIERFLQFTSVFPATGEVVPSLGKSC